MPAKSVLTWTLPVVFLGGGYFVYRNLPTRASVEPGLEAQVSLAPRTEDSKPATKREALVAPDPVAPEQETSGQAPAKPTPAKPEAKLKGATERGKSAPNRPGDTAKPVTTRPSEPGQPTDSAGKPEKYVDHAGKQELRDGMLYLYDAEGLVLEQMGPFQNGKRTGSWETYSATSKVLVRGNYSDGIADGLWEGWYETGARHFSGNKVAGQFEGQVDYWLPSGEVSEAESGFYEGGKKVTPE